MLKRGMIYLDANQCPNCGGKLHLVSVEKSISNLSNDGIPVIDRNIDDEIEIWLSCKKCKTLYDVEKNGLYFGIKRDLPVIEKDIDDFNPFLIN